MDRLKSPNLSQLCPVCDADTMHTFNVSLLSFSSIFIIRLAIFSYCDGQPTRDNRKVDCLLKDSRLTLSIPTCPSANDSLCQVSFNNSFALKATINHVGTVVDGHYTAFVKDASSNWFFCNDSVRYRQQDSVNNTSSYLFFYVRK